MRRVPSRINMHSKACILEELAMVPMNVRTCWFMTITTLTIEEKASRERGQVGKCMFIDHLLQHR